MTERAKITLLPYSYIKGQKQLHTLLEVAYVMPSSAGGVLVSGERGTAKSTVVRSFAAMMHNKLPVTLPINATDDRVMGGWQIEALMQGNAERQKGLLEQAAISGMLYIDEVNLLDDHIINLILDVVSTGVLVVEREGMDDSQTDVSFMLVGTMNPDEGLLRPQLLDRFGLFAPSQAEVDSGVRRDILFTVLTFDDERDKERGKERSEWLDIGRQLDSQKRADIERAKLAVPGVRLTTDTIDLCARVAAEFDVVGHRAEIVMAHAARAVAALADRRETIPADIGEIAQYAVMHRRRDATYAEGFEWTGKDRERLAHVLATA